MYKILSHLYIGSYEEACQPPEFITSRLNVAEERDLPFHPCLVDKKVSIRDMTSIPVDQLEDAVRFIKDNITDHIILVSCNAGIGRSPSVVVAYLCMIGFGFGEAVEFVATRKPTISTLPDLISGIAALRHKKTSQP